MFWSYENREWCWVLSYLAKIRAIYDMVNMISFIPWTISSQTNSNFKKGDCIIHTCGYLERHHTLWHLSVKLVVNLTLVCWSWILIFHFVAYWFLSFGGAFITYYMWHVEFITYYMWHVEFTAVLFVCVQRCEEVVQEAESFTRLIHTETLKVGLELIHSFSIARKDRLLSNVLFIEQQNAHRRWIFNSYNWAFVK